MQGLAVMKQIYNALQQFEVKFEEIHGVSLNEAMLLSFLLEKGSLTSSQLADCCGLLNSHTSKLIRSLENKHLISRRMGETDKRQMYFELMELGQQKLEGMQCGSVEIPEILQPIFEKECLRLRGL